jgi:hypothetical protein
MLKTDIGNINMRQTLEMPLHDQQIGVCYAITTIFKSSKSERRD